MLSKAWYLQVELHVCTFCCWCSRLVCSCLGCSVAGASCPTDAQERRDGTHPLGDGGPACWPAPGEELENFDHTIGGEGQNTGA